MRTLPGAFVEATCVADFLPAAGFLDPATCWFALAGESTLETVVVLQPLVKMLPAPRQTTPAPAIQPSFRRRSVDPIITLLPSWNRAYGKARTGFIDKRGEDALSDYPSSRMSRDIARSPRLNVFAVCAIDRSIAAHKQNRERSFDRSLFESSAPLDLSSL